MSLSTHVLDTALGKPAAGVPILLERSASGWKRAGHGVTDADGRCKTLLKGALKKGTYRLTFGTAAYFKKSKQKGFYPTVAIVFVVKDARHHHVPLLLAPWGYSTYRGS